ncbi:MAG: hypothetical protein J5806_02645, partial [Lentisphaeria bacterium]|nr:hypothetical protein [Lentisphaeria bacterium]
MKRSFLIAGIAAGVLCAAPHVMLAGPPPPHHHHGGSSGVRLATDIVNLVHAVIAPPAVVVAPAPAPAPVVPEPEPEPQDEYEEPEFPAISGEEEPGDEADVEVPAAPSAANPAPAVRPEPVHAPIPTQRYS